MTGTEGGRYQPASSSGSHTIAAFRYQLLQSVAALLALQEGETLLLEVSEDFSVVSTDVSTDVQVKHSQAATGRRAFSLQSPEVLAALSRFWEARDQASGRERRLVFLARGGAAVERAFTFPNGGPGLIYWTAAAIDADTTPLRHALKALFPDHPLGEWLASNPTDDELRNRLLRRVGWQLNEQPAEALVLQTRDQLSTIYYSKGLPVTAADQAVNTLVALALEVASRPQSKDRTLNRVDLHRVLEEVAGTSLVARAMASPAPTEAQVAQDILVSEPIGVSSTLAARSETVNELLNQIRGKPLLWLHGAHGVGKSTLARLIAQRMGGRWLVLDLRPVQRDPVASVAAWRELLRAITVGIPLDGIIVDDFASEAANALWSRLAALVRTFGARGGRVIVTSHQEPSPARLLEFSPGTAGVIQAPYLGESDIAELVRMSPSPEANTIEAWSRMILLTTGGGQPVLVAAKVASNRARGWPKAALTEDIVSASPALKLTREEARRNLLRDLRELDAARSLEAGQLLRRIACAFDRVEDVLIRRLAQASPVLTSGSDALSVLRGTWLESLPHGDLRISPLLADLGSDVPPEEAKGWRRLAAEHWLSKRKLNERTLPLCFWNAFWGEHDSVLLKLCEVLQTLPREKLLGAAPLLSPMIALATDKSIYPDPLVAAYLRVLQFDVADAVEEPDIAGKIAARLLVEIDALEENSRVFVLTAAGPRVLMANSANFEPALRLKYALRVRDAWVRVAELSGGEIAEPRSLLPPEFGPDLDFADFLFATVIQHTRGSQDTLETFRALDGLPTEVRNRFINAMSVIFAGPTGVVNSGWSLDHLHGRDMSIALRCYDIIASLVANWARSDLDAEVACARSVILDEGLNRPDAAIAVTDEAIEKLGKMPALVRQKSKVLGHIGSHLDATELLLSIEDQVGQGSALERAFALRDGGVSAAIAKRFSDAARLFDKAREAISSSPENAPLASALLVEKALVLWRSGEKVQALIVVADALDAVEAFPINQSRQAERSHQYARAIIGLFFSERTTSGGTPFTINHGQASSLEGTSAKLLNVDLKPLADNWRMLAAVEADLGIDVGIDARSMAKLKGPLSVSVEFNVRANRYAAALRSGDPERALRAGIDLWNVAKARQDATPDAQGLLRVDASKFAFGDPKSLVVDAAVIELINWVLLDLVLARTIGWPVDEAFLASLARAAKAVFGDAVAIDVILRAAAAPRRVGRDAGRTEILLSGIAIPDNDADEDPSVRFYRDMMIVGHLNSSMAQFTLAAQAAEKIVRGWKFVIDRQRFRLLNPRDNVPAMEAAILKVETDGLPAVAQLLLAAASSVEHQFTNEWIEMLQKLAKETR